MMWHLTGEPRSVQERALEKASGQRGFGYFMEQGLGKTAVAINEFVDLLMQDEVQKMIVVCPNTLKVNWEKEIGYWTGNRLSVSRWPNLMDDADVWVFNYESMTYKGGDALLGVLSQYDVYLVLDESTRIKNPSSKTAKFFIVNCRLAAYVRVLTGTPMAESVIDLWPQLRAIGYLNGVNRVKFRNRYAVVGGYMGKQVLGVKNRDELISVMDQAGFRAKKKDWTDLPDKIFGRRWVEMTSKQQEAFGQMLQFFYYEITQDQEVSAEFAITQMGKLQQICGGFVYDDDGNPSYLVEKTKDNPKVQAVVEAVQEIEGRVIIVAVHNPLIEMLIEMFPSASFIRGGMTDDELADSKERFNEGDARQMICQIAAGHMGHTLLGPDNDRCSTMVFAENLYSLLYRSQMEDRIHRFGQTEHPLYIDLITHRVEERIVKALQKKERVAASIVDSVKSVQENSNAKR